MYKNAEQIIDECNKIYTPNAGVKALAKEAYNDPDGFCIMDDENIYDESYRCECPDRGMCYRADYMLACVQTRSEIYNAGLKGKAIKIYNNGMGYSD